MTTNPLKGSITITRCDNSFGGPYISISINDETSGASAIEINVSPDSFAMALTGLGYQDCTFTPASPKVGKVRQVKEERVLFLDSMEAALAPHEVDGWKACRDGYYHNCNRDGKFVNITFVRYVDEK